MMPSTTPLALSCYECPTSVRGTLSKEIQHLTATILSLTIPPSIQGDYQLRHNPFQQQDQVLENHPCTRISCGPKRIHEASSPVFCSVFENHSPQSHTLTQPPDQSCSQKEGSKEHFRSLTWTLRPALIPGPHH